MSPQSLSPSQIQDEAMHLPSSQRNWSELQVLTMVAAGMKHTAVRRATCPRAMSLSDLRGNWGTCGLRNPFNHYMKRDRAAAGIPLPQEFWERISIPLSSVPLEQKAPRGAVITGTKARGWGSVCERGGGRDCQRKGRCVCVCVCVCVWGLAERHFGGM